MCPNVKLNLVLIRGPGRTGDMSELPSQAVYPWRPLVDAKIRPQTAGLDDRINPNVEVLGLALTYPHATTSVMGCRVSTLGPKSCSLFVQCTSPRLPTHGPDRSGWRLLHESCLAHSSSYVLCLGPQPVSSNVTSSKLYIVAFVAEQRKHGEFTLLHVGKPNAEHCSAQSALSWTSRNLDLIWDP